MSARAAQCSHIMAMSVQRLFPGTQVTIGPWIDRGFYYDFDTPQALSQEDLKGIKKEMQRIIKQKLPFIREEARVHPQLPACCGRGREEGC